MWVFDLFWKFYLLDNWLFVFLSVPSSVAASLNAAGGAILPWLAEEICEDFEDSKFYKMNNVLSIVITTKAVLRTCACSSGAFNYQRNLCIWHCFGVWDNVLCDKSTVASLQSWIISSEFKPNLWFSSKYFFIPIFKSFHSDLDT